MNEDTPKRTISHKLAIINKTITQQASSAQSKLHILYQYLKTPAGKELLEYYKLQEEGAIQDLGVGMSVCMYK